MVTLEWNTEDVGKAYAAYISGDLDPVDNITLYGLGDDGDVNYRESKVLNDSGEMIGVATDKNQDFYHKKMISLAVLDKEYAEEGKELSVLWGTDPAKQMKIRATVAQFPYYNGEWRNETCDVYKMVPQTK